LRKLIEDRDEALLNAVGGFDDRQYKRLGDDLLTLWLNILHAAKTGSSSKV
jgi:hypothetical protein